MLVKHYQTLLARLNSTMKHVGFLVNNVIVVVKESLVLLRLLRTFKLLHVLKKIMKKN